MESKEPSEKPSPGMNHLIQKKNLHCHLVDMVSYIISCG